MNVLTDYNRLQRLYSYLSGFTKNVAGSLGDFLKKRWVRLSLQVIIISFSVLYLLRSFQSVDLSQLNIKLDYWQIGWSFLVTVGALLFGGLGWWLTLLSLGQKIDLGEAVRIHLVSNLAKYVPGYAWQLVSKGYLTRNAGVPALLVGVSMTLELSQIFLTGIFLIILFFPAEMISSLEFINNLGENLFFIKVSLLVMISLFPILLPAIVKRINPVAARMQVSTPHLLLATWSILIGWLLFGLGFWLLGNAVQTIPFQSMSLFIFALAASFLIGLLIIIIPASIGVREGLMVFFLSSTLTAPFAVIVASLSRLVLTICELLAAGGVVLCARWRQNRS